MEPLLGSQQVLGRSQVESRIENKERELTLDGASREGLCEGTLILKWKGQERTLRGWYHCEREAAMWEAGGDESREL